MSEENCNQLRYGVVRGAHKHLRLGISDGQSAYGDHLRIEVMLEKEPGKWWWDHIDADCAEALGKELIRRAAYLRGR